MQKSFIMITASALSLAFGPSPSFGYQKPTSPAVSAQQSRADARKAANDAKDAAQKAADAANLAFETTAKHESHNTAQQIRAATLRASEAATRAEEKTEQAYQKAVASNKEVALRVNQAAKNATAATTAALEKAEESARAASESDKEAAWKTAARHAQPSRRLRRPLKMVSKQPTKRQRVLGKRTWRRSAPSNSLCAPQGAGFASAVECVHNPMPPRILLIECRLMRQLKEEHRLRI